jgi:hypothetical protein
MAHLLFPTQQGPLFFPFPLSLFKGEASFLRLLRDLISSNEGMKGIE